MAMLSDDRWNDHINTWLHELSGWEAALESGTIIEPASDLAGDDDLCPGAPTSGSASLGIWSAVDHLSVLGDALRMSQIPRPFGYFSLARAALFASARTVWILSPDEREVRQERGLWTEWQSDRFFAKTIALLEEQPDAGPRDAASTLADRVVKHRAMLYDAAATIGVDLAPRHSPSDSEIVKQAGMWLECQHGEPGLASGLAWQWHTHSGAAHSLAWVLVGKVDLERTYPDGTGEGTWIRSLEDLGLAFGTAMRTTRDAVQLFRARAAAV